MHIFKKIFTILAIIFGSLGLMNIVSTDVALPLMYFFMGLTLLTTAKEFYDKNKKKDAIISIVAAILVYCGLCMKVTLKTILPLSGQGLHPSKKIISSRKLLPLL